MHHLVLDAGANFQRYRKIATPQRHESLFIVKIESRGTS